MECWYNETVLNPKRSRCGKPYKTNHFAYLDLCRRSQPMYRLTLPQCRKLNTRGLMQKSRMLTPRRSYLNSCGHRIRGLSAILFSFTSSSPYLAHERTLDGELILSAIDLRGLHGFRIPWLITPEIVVLRPQNASPPHAGRHS